MKLYQYIVGCALCLTSLTACNDWLEVEPGNNLSTENFYTNPGELEQALNGIYNGLLPLAEYSWIMSEIRSDNVWTESLTGAQRDYVDICTYNLNIVTISTLHKAWVDLYEIVARSNTFLKKIEGVDFGYTTTFDVKASFVAEARLLRALAYFDLVRYFGRVPIVLEPQSIKEAMNTKQSEDYEVYENVIIPDLLYAVGHMDVHAYNYTGSALSTGRANQMVARSLLGKVYLTMAGFPLNDTDKAALAEEQLEAVIDYAEANNKYWTKDIDEWQKMWISDNDNKYHIFEIQYIAESGYGNTMVYYTTPKVPSTYISISMSGYNLRCANDLNAILKADKNGDGLFDDLRCVATVDTARWTTYDNGLTYEKWYTGDDYFVKFFEHKIKRKSLGFGDIDAQIVDRNYFPLNYPLIRLEDVMLMYAEVVGATVKSIRLVDKIRTRAGLSALSPAEIAEFPTMVELERRRELAGEGIRWHDLVRLNKYRTALQNKFRQYGSDELGNVTRPLVYNLANRVIEGTHLYPIPDTQMKVQEGLYEQNAAYK